MNTLVWKFLILALICWQPFKSSLAAQWAEVSAQKALIYADVEMTAPIGYFKKGQKLRVGEVARNKGRLLPTAYKGRVVYVQTADIQTNKELALVRSATERIKDADKKKRQSRVSLGYNGFLSTISDSSSGSDESFFFSGAGLHGYTRKSGEESALKMKFDYLSGKKDQSVLTMLLMTGEYSQNILQNKYFNLGAFAGISLTPWAQYEIEGLFKVNGYGAGAGAGLEMFIGLGADWGLSLEGKYQYLKLMGFDLPEGTQENPVADKFEPTISGLNFVAALSYLF
ncbi:MAG: hypothetical protein WD025_01835 [Bacteriovoracaceae bacterium]